jgi:methylenetetrahydrofolate dehydrogenase (NADP+)/methenyltetrahydrofolate cyclohydrolase
VWCATGLRSVSAFSLVNVMIERKESLMAATLIDGKALAARLRQQLTTEVEELRQRGVVPGLAVVLVGDDPASRVYVSMKEKACAQVGIFSAEHRLPAETSQQQLLELIGQLNQDRRIDGILVQLPLPGHIDENAIIAAIDPAKDVDGFHPVSVGRLAIGQPGFRSCTPFGVMKMLEDIGCDLNGKEVVVVGRSNIVGKPVALMCLAQNATVTLCHSRTRDLAAHVGRADVVIAAVGRPEMIQGDWIKPGAVVIDVGINRLTDGRLVGDVAFETAAARASAITPVPGGVGPMTITMLLYNTVESAGQRP